MIVVNISCTTIVDYLYICCTTDGRFTFILRLPYRHYGIQGAINLHNIKIHLYPWYIGQSSELSIQWYKLLQIFVILKILNMRQPRNLLRINILVSCILHTQPSNVYLSLCVSAWVHACAGVCIHACVHVCAGTCMCACAHE